MRSRPTAESPATFATSGEGARQRSRSLRMAQGDGDAPASPSAPLSLDLPASPGVRCPMSDKLLEGDTREVAIKLSQTWPPGFRQPALT
jgi:hypothetical protein